MFRKFWLPLLIVALLSLPLLYGCATDDDDDDNDDDDTIDDDTGDDDTADDDTGDDDVTPDDDDDTVSEVFRAGFAQVDITPSVSVKLAGYDMFFLAERFCRWSTAVHDPLYAHAVAFDDPDGAAPVVFIVADLIGLFVNDIEIVQQGVAAATGLAPENVLVAATHTHHGPDTIGIWGVIIPPISGRQEKVIDAMLAGMIEAGVQAWVAREEATLAYAVGLEADLHKNTIDDPNRTIDDTMTVLAAYDADGNMLGTLTNWGAHPTVMGQDSTVISSDFAGVLYRLLGEELGGVHLFVNALVGAMIQPEPNWVDPDEWDEVEAVGRGLADDVHALLAEATPIDEPTIDFFASRACGVTLINPIFTLAGSLGLIARDLPALGETAWLNISSFNVGPVVFGTLPGELVPDYSTPLREAMDGEAQMLIGLGQDWVGYVLTPDQFASLPYWYESILCPNPQTGERIVATYEEIRETRAGSAF